MTDLRIEALDYARRVVAALEQQAEGTPQQIEALRAELDKVRHQLHNASNAAIWSAGVLRGEPVPPRSPGVPISLLETAASDAHTKIREQAREINSRDNQIDQMAADIAKLTNRASIAEAANREKDKQLAVALDRVHQLEQVHDQQVAALTAARNNVDALQRDQVREHADRLEAIAMLEGRRVPQLNQTEVKSKLLREVSAVMRALESQPAKANELRRQLAEANDQITNHTDVIKELHKQYHELEARKMATQYDLDRANDEIAAAEAEIAKYKPLIEAVRGGIAYCYWGKWVPINSVTVADMNDGTAVSLFIPNSEGSKCL